MSDQPAEASWLSDLRSKIGTESEAIAVAVDDLAATLGDESEERVLSTWVDLAHGKRVTAYVLTPDLLHRLSGKRNPMQDERETTCGYDAFPITRDATFSLAVTVKPRPNNVRTVEREWTFSFDDDANESIRVAAPTDKQKIDDATPFARALAASIVAAFAARAVWMQDAAPLGW
jgi:hypothetical protein